MTNQPMQIVGITVPAHHGNDIIAQFCEKYSGQLINFYTSNLEELGVIAKHRVLPVPTILIISGTKVVGRVVKDIPTLPDLDRLLILLKESKDVLE
jgi:hypothetical protein